MEKKSTPAMTVILYIVGIIFLIVGAFMLATAISYTKTYLQSYDATFSSMWSNSVQYIITQCAVYFGLGFACIGIGKGIKEARTAQSAARTAAKDAAKAAASVIEKAEEVSSADLSERDINGAKETYDRKLQDIATEVATLREVLSIKIEEKEKRDTYRINELAGQLENMAKAVKPAESKEDEIKSSHNTDEVNAGGKKKKSNNTKKKTEDRKKKPSSKATKKSKKSPTVPQIMRRADIMAMPDIVKK